MFLKEYNYFKVVMLTLQCFPRHRDIKDLFAREGPAGVPKDDIVIVLPPIATRDTCRAKSSNECIMELECKFNFPLYYDSREKSLFGEGFKYEEMYMVYFNLGTPVLTYFHSPTFKQVYTQGQRGQLTTSEILNMVEKAFDEFNVTWTYSWNTMLSEITSCRHERHCPACYSKTAGYDSELHCFFTCPVIKSRPQTAGTLQRLLYGRSASQKDVEWLKSPSPAEFDLVLQHVENVHRIRINTATLALTAPTNESVFVREEKPQNEEIDELQFNINVLKNGMLELIEEACKSNSEVSNSSPRPNSKMKPIGAPVTTKHFDDVVSPKQLKPRFFGPKSKATDVPDSVRKNWEKANLSKSSRSKALLYPKNPVPPPKRQEPKEPVVASLETPSQKKLLRPKISFAAQPNEKGYIASSTLECSSVVAPWAKDVPQTQSMASKKGTGKRKWTEVLPEIQSRALTESTGRSTEATGKTRKHEEAKKEMMTKLGLTTEPPWWDD